MHMMAATIVFPRSPASTMIPGTNPRLAMTLAIPGLPVVPSSLAGFPVSTRTTISAVSIHPARYPIIKQINLCSIRPLIRSVCLPAFSSMSAPCLLILGKPYSSFFSCQFQPSLEREGSFSYNNSRHYVVSIPKVKQRIEGFASHADHIKLHN